jgi:hypothetical protein
MDVHGSSESSWRSSGQFAADSNAKKSCGSDSRENLGESDGCVAFSYAREEPAGGALLKGRRNLGATTRGESYEKSVAEPSTMATAGSVTPGAAIPIGARPALQSPRQLHWRD